MTMKWIKRAGSGNIDQEEAVTGITANYLSTTLESSDGETEVS